MPPLGQPAVVALVPVNDVARRYLRHDVYICDRALRGQLWLRATHVGWSDGGRIAVIRPVTRRWLIGSAAAHPSTGLHKAAGVLAESGVDRNWTGHSC